ncbi:c-type cytochrome [Deinococcus pimensis]|uniref:c-type cytochrome n=1 Tax=Deinococcus pimensis TaxID=309888 RepID=UPI0006939C67|nr:cytochrome c [Deinococcus pimensis]
MPMGRSFALLTPLLLVSGALAAGPPFTAAQAKAGQATYKANCQSCHGAKLQGGAGPALMGSHFDQRWMGKKLDDLYYITHSLMPLNAPGSLSTTQYLDTLAYILQSNKFKPGSKPLTATAVKTALIKR